jgi:intergrase/recombinase
MTTKTCEDRLRYARQFGNILSKGDLSPLLQLSAEKKIHVQKALSCLARFTGCYEEWMQLRKRYNLKWTTGVEKLAAFERFFDAGKSLDVMIEQLKDTINMLPVDYANVYRFCALTGLRCSESINSIRLIREPGTLKEYYNEQDQTLMHFKYSELFVRRTKCAWITITPKQVLDLALKMKKTPTLQGVKSGCKRRSIPLQLKFCRKINGTWLQSQGVPESAVDLLHGRASKSIFVRNYVLGSSDLKEKVLRAVNELSKRID